MCSEKGRSSRDQAAAPAVAADIVDNGTCRRLLQTAGCRTAQSTCEIGESPCTVETDSSRYCTTRDPESKGAQGAAGPGIQKDGLSRQVNRGSARQDYGMSPEATAISSRY